MRAIFVEEDDDPGGGHRNGRSMGCRAGWQAGHGGRRAGRTYAPGMEDKRVWFTSQFINYIFVRNWFNFNKFIFRSSLLYFVVS